MVVPLPDFFCCLDAEHAGFSLSDRLTGEKQIHSTEWPEV